MGILKSLDNKIKKAEQKYTQIKKDTANLRRAAGQVSDYIIPPPKKGNKAVHVKVSKCPPPPKVPKCPCLKKYKKTYYRR